MISAKHHPEDNFVELHVEGKLSKSDYDKLVPKVEKLLDEESPVGFLVKLENFKGWEPGAFAREVALDVKHRSQFGRMAVVGGGRLTEWTTELSKLFFPSEVRYFSKDEANEARSWLGSPDLATDGKPAA